MKKILFIEDEPELCQAYKEKFQKKYNIDFAMNSADGLKKIQSWFPDLIILDILIPGETNGIGLLKEIKMSAKTKHIPVLVLTNLENQDETVISLGAKECLIKSNISFESVASKVSKLLD